MFFTCVYPCVAPFAVVCAIQVRGEGHQEEGAEDGGRGRGAAAADAGVRAQLAHYVRAGAPAAVLPVRQPAHRHARGWAAVCPVPAVMIVTDGQ